MLYICPWQAPAFPPQRLISSITTEASDDAEARAAVLLRDQRSEPARARERRDELLGIAAALVDLAEIRRGKLRAQVAHALADVRVAFVERRRGGPALDALHGLPSALVTDRVSPIFITSKSCTESPAAARFCASKRGGSSRGSSVRFSNVPQCIPTA